VKEFLENLNIEDLMELEPESTPVSDNIITADDCSIVVVGIGRRAYVNSIEGRASLLSDCTRYNQMDLYEQVLTVWGTNPTVIEPEEEPKSLEQLKAEKLEELENAFDTAVKGSFATIEGYNMQFDVTDSLKMQGAMQLMEATGATEGYITQANDVTEYHVPLATMKAVLVEMLAAYAQCHARKQELRAQINAAQNMNELNAIQISWPV